MLYVIFNSDGSLKTLVVGESIQQGDHLSKQIFAAIDGVSNSEYTCSAEFVLPSGEIEELTSIIDNENIETDDQNVGNIEYHGYSVILSEAVTRQAGNLKVNLKLIDLQGVIRCTYQFKLKINPTGYNPNDSRIIEAQYNALLQSLNSYQLKTAAECIFNASGKTVAELYAVSGDKTKIFSLSGITNEGQYFGRITYNELESLYYFELERVGFGVRNSQDRWFGSVTGDVLVNALLTPYNEWYAPYLVNGNTADASLTLTDLKNKIGEVVHIINVVNSTRNLNGYFICKLATGTSDTVSFVFIYITAKGGEYIDYRFAGTNVSGSLTLDDILNVNSVYFTPIKYERKIALQDEDFDLSDVDSSTWRPTDVLHFYYPTDEHTVEHVRFYPTANTVIDNATGTEYTEWSTGDGRSIVRAHDLDNDEYLLFYQAKSHLYEHKISIHIETAFQEVNPDGIAIATIITNSATPLDTLAKVKDFIENNARPIPVSGVLWSENDEIICSFVELSIYNNELILYIGVSASSPFNNYIDEQDLSDATFSDFVNQIS